MEGGRQGLYPVMLSGPCSLQLADQGHLLGRQCERQNEKELEFGNREAGAISSHGPLSKAHEIFEI